MFRQSKVFNRDISKWDVSSMTKMGYVFGCVIVQAEALWDRLGSVYTVGQTKLT